MRFALAPAAEAAGYRLAAFEEVGSTSAEALARARAGERGPLWIVAGRQSAGRGRRGSAWHSPAGNLSASLLVTTELPAATAAQLGFVAGLALARALEVRCGKRGPSTVCAPPSPEDRAEAKRGFEPGGGQTAGVSPSRSGFAGSALSSGEGETSLATFRLKWPNDVLAGGAKLAGILLQSEEVLSARPGDSWDPGTRPEPGLGCRRDEREARGLRAVAIGIGVNVAVAPHGLPYPATSLGDLGCAVDAPTLLWSLSETWLGVHAEWDHGRGFDAVREAWLARAAGVGGAVAVRTGAAVTRGVFETIDEHGQLVVRAHDGSARRVSAGEVYFGPAATVRVEACA